MIQLERDGLLEALPRKSYGGMSTAVKVFLALPSALTRRVRHQRWFRQLPLALPQCPSKSLLRRAA